MFARNHWNTFATPSVLVLVLVLVASTPVYAINSDDDIRPLAGEACGDAGLDYTGIKLMYVRYIKNNVLTLVEITCSRGGVVRYKKLPVV